MNLFKSSICMEVLITTVLDTTCLQRRERQQLRRERQGEVCGLNFPTQACTFHGALLLWERHGSLVLHSAPQLRSHATELGHDYEQDRRHFIPRYVPTPVTYLP